MTFARKPNRERSYMTKNDKFDLCNRKVSLRRLKMRKIKTILLTLFVALGSFMLCGCSNKMKIDLNKYIKIKTTGFDSIGTADLEFDMDAFRKDYDGKIKRRDNEENEYVTENLIDLYVRVFLDKEEGLSNGDVLNVEWSVKKEAAEEKYDCELVYKDIAYTVKDLKTPEEFDPFDYLDVRISGVSPNGWLEICIRSGEEAMGYVSIDAEKRSNISSEEEVKVTVTANEKELLELFGKKLSKTEQIYSEKLPG